MLPREHYLKQTFQDPVHFPNGLEKGGLSDIQARLVRKNGSLINALCIDEVSDPTNDDLHILKVIANQSAPKSPVEQAWIKYLNIVKNLTATAPGKSKSAKAKTAKPAEPAPEAPAVIEEKPTKATKSAKSAPAPEPKAKAKEKAAPEPKKAAAKKAEPVKPDTKKAKPKA